MNLLGQALFILDITVRDDNVGNNIIWTDKPSQPIS